MDCPRDDDTSIPQFLSLLREYIQSQNEKELDLFEDAKVLPSPGTFVGKQAKEPITQVITGVEVSDEPLDILKDDHISQKTTASVSQCIFLIPHETFTQTWTPDPQKGLTKSKVRTQILAQIETFCDCRLDVASTSDAGPKIVIKSDSQQSINSAIAKLRRVDDILRQQIPYIFSFPITEGKLSIRLQLTALRNLKDARLHKTLLPPKTPLNQNLCDATVVSMVQGEQIIPFNTSPLKNTPTELSLWKEHPYREYGSKSAIETQQSLALTASTIQHNDLAEKLATPTGQWLQQNPSQYEDAFKPIAVEAQQQMAVSVKDIATTDPDPVRQPPRRLRIPRKAARSAAVEASSTTQEVMSGATSPTKGPEDVSSASEGAIISPNDFGSSKGSQQSLQLSGAPTIEPPYMPPFTNTAKSKRLLRNSTTTPPTSVTGSSSRSAEWQSAVIQEFKGGELIDLSLESRKVANPKATRRVMGQRKPQQRITGGQENMMKGFEEAATKLLNLCLSHRGNINFEVGIGRLIISSQPNVAQAKKPFTVGEWFSVFPMKGQRESLRSTTFTPRLTTRAREIEAVLHLKLTNGRRLWRDEPRQRRVIYSIACVTKNDEKIVIDVAEDGTFQTKGTQLLIGAIDWHYPVRSWDARLRIIAHEPIFGSYEQQVTGIVDNMTVQIQEHGKAIRFSTIAIDGVVRIESVTLRRETVHSSVVYPDLLFHLTEVQDLAVFVATGKLTGTDTRYQGTILTPARMMSVGRLWWETSVTSIHASNILQENNALELGEVAKWKPEDIIRRGVIKDMYALANELVTNMDFVGFYNKTVPSTPDPMTGIRSQSVPISIDPEGEYPW